MVWSIGVGIMAVLFGLGFFIVCVRIGGLLGRIGKTLDEIDRQIPLLSSPIATTLTHVGGIADTADATIARLGVAVGQLENVAAGATRTANTIGVVVSNVAAGIRKPKSENPAGEPI
jgi:hypothetical protein